MIKDKNILSFDIHFNDTMPGVKLHLAIYRTKNIEMWAI